MLRKYLINLVFVLGIFFPMTRLFAQITNNMEPEIAGKYLLNPSDKDSIYVQITMSDENRWNDYLKKNINTASPAVWYRTGDSDTILLASLEGTRILKSVFHASMHALTLIDGKRGGYTKHLWSLNFKVKNGAQMNDFILYCDHWMPEAAFWISDRELWIKARRLLRNTEDAGNHAANDFIYLKIIF